MKLNKTKVVPIVSEVGVMVDGLVYEGKTYNKVAITCDIDGKAHQASLDTSIIGSGSWAKEFGKKQTRGLKALCQKTVKEWVKKQKITTWNSF